MEQLDVKKINIRLPIIEFNQYDFALSQAKRAAEVIEKMEVTEENIKECKKKLAGVNNSVKVLNDFRISVKKEILKPYEIFNEQIKNIENVVKTADEKIRQQVRELEEIQRDNKREELKEIWDKRVVLYDLSSKIFNFDNWCVPKHLNKTETITKCEADLVNWLETRETELVTLYKMDKSDEYISEYKKTMNLAIAIQKVNDRIEQIQKQKEILKKVEEQRKVKEPKKFEKIIKITDEKDYKLLLMLLKDNDIKFEIIGG